MSRSGPSNRKMRRHSAQQKRKGGSAPPQADIQVLIDLCRGGRFDEARPAAQTFTRRWPSHPVGWNALAMAHDGLNEPAAAAAAYRRALECEPNNVEARNNLGNALRASGEPAAAVKAFREVLTARPDHVTARFNLGLALEDQGEAGAAVTAYQEVLERRPGFAEAAIGMARAQGALGDHAAGEATLRQALAQQPRHAGLLASLADLLAADGREDEAERCYREAIKAHPGEVHLRLNLANLLRHRESLTAAEAECREALKRAPDLAAVHFALAGILAAGNRLTAARESHERALELDPDLVPAWHDLGDVLMDLGQLDEAESAHRRAAELSPDVPEAWRNLGVALAVMGRRERAIAALRHALTLRPDYGEAWYHLAVTKRFTDEQDDDLTRIEALLAGTTLADDDRAWLHYAAGKAVDDLGTDPRRMFEHCQAANRIRRAELDYDVVADETFLADVATAFADSATYGATDGGDPSPAPVFIVGMWRSGTTLVEHILASHGEMHGGGERNELPSLVTARDQAESRPFPAWVDGLDAASRADLGGQYRARVIDPVADSASRVTDKRPDNFRYLGLIAELLPNARIIHVRRHPLDTCLSMFTRPLSVQMPYAFDLVELGRYYRAYAELMAHWREVLPAGMLLEIDYEALVADTEAQSRRLVEHVGLDWDPACLDFHRNERAVVTASLAQVRQPIYHGSVERWRPYADHLQPLIDTLGPLAATDSAASPQ